MENLSWENADLGISFSVAYGRITVFKTTLKAIGLRKWRKIGIFILRRLSNPY